MHNIPMNNYSNHVAIIGAGISGLTLGCILKSANIPVVIFEKSLTISNQGAGISISPNGINVLKHLGIYDEIKNQSANPKLAEHFSNNNIISSFSVDVLTTSRQTIYQTLVNKYQSIGGDIFFDHELVDINQQKCELVFSNNQIYRVLHIAACDGIKSFCRGKLMPDRPIYSGYSVWRSIINKKQETIKTYLGPKYHVVAYPINDHQVSIVAAVKTDKEYKESWKVGGTLDELREDLSMPDIDILSNLENETDLYKWGVFTRPMPNKLYSKNITILGDAAHPIVPFIGQGGCLALEDAYILGKLIISMNMDFIKIQKTYQKLRFTRIKKIKLLSERQGHLNHISNKFIILIRNFFMKHIKFFAMYSIRKIWDYDAEKEVLKIK